MGEALIGFAAFLALAFLRVPMAFAMGIVGFAGVVWKLNLHAASAMVAQVTYEHGSPVRAGRGRHCAGRVLRQWPSCPRRALR